MRDFVQEQHFAAQKPTHASTLANPSLSESNPAAQSLKAASKFGALHWHTPKP
ncbi:hypothetical protein [Helicobacter canis]|uniref:hypothetical protein n=1 Tax=Helicobacter canis TaxID=29419 RepID=UPI001478EDFE|nr:hypothetical protein [Helicobacter canis]